MFVVTFGVTLDDFFIRMPRTVREAEGWSLVNSDCLDGTGKFHGHRYAYPGDKSHTLIFDTNGIIAGVQTYVRALLT